MSRPTPGSSAHGKPTPKKGSTGTKDLHPFGDIELEVNPLCATHGKFNESKKAGDDDMDVEDLIKATRRVTRQLSSRKEVDNVNQTLREKIHTFLEDPNSTTGAYYYNLFLAIVISVGYASSLFMTVRQTQLAHMPYNKNNFRPNAYVIASIIFQVIFGLDILMRLIVAPVWCCSPRSSGSGSSTSTQPYFQKLYNWIDIFAFWAYFLGCGSFAAALRFFRLARHLPQFNVLIEVMMMSARTLMFSVFFFVTVVIFFGSLILALESCYNVDCEFPDVLDAMYFNTITATTVGYGDQIPNNPFARALTVIVMLFGAFYISMPLAVIGAKFDEAWADYQSQRAEFDTKLKESQQKLNELNTSRPQRERRLLYFSHQISDALNGCRDLRQALAVARANKPGTKKTASARNALQLSLERLLFIVGRFCDDLMVLFKINKQDVLQPQVESSSKSPGSPEQVRSNPPVSSTQRAPPRRTSALTWSSSDDRRSMEAAALKVRFPRSQLLQARTEQILGASMVRRSRDGLVLAGQFWSQQKSGVSQSKTDALQEDSDEDSSRCWCRLGLVEDDDNIEHYVDEAKRSSDWRDKLWVSIEVPHATPLAGWVRLTRLLLTFLALSMVMMESNPAFNKYGESTIACRLVVNQYCRWVSTCEADGNCPDQAIANASNPACFPDPTTGYGGCAGELSAAHISQCAFPAVELGMSCSGVNATRFTREPFGASWLTSLDHVPVTSPNFMCQRLQCHDNSAEDKSWGNSDYTAMFASLEVLFIVIFSTEFTLRIIAATAAVGPPFKDFFRDPTNYVDFLAVLIPIVEIVASSTWSETFRYSVFGWWGSSVLDAANFRFTRVVIAFRFMLQMRHYHDTRIIFTTFAQVIHKLVVPLLFFFVLACFFGGLLFMAEGGSLYRCSDWSSPSTNDGNCELCYGPPAHSEPLFNALVRIFDSSIPHVTYDLSDPWLGHEEWYNGTCRYLHLVPTGGEGIGAIRSLQTPLILDGFEGIWTIIVTMTTVGYGGRFPKTTSGKFIVIVAAILGAFYLAMPLSILATQFNQNFQKREDDRAEEDKKRKLRKLMRSGHLKLMPIVRMKLWAKRAVARVKGYHHSSGRSERYRSLVREYVIAANNLADSHDYNTLETEFRELHSKLTSAVVSAFSRNIDPDIQYTKGALALG